MSEYRRAVPGPAVVTAIRSVIVALASSLAGTLVVMGLISVRMARRIITPGGRVPDTRIVDVDTAAQTITLGKTADTVLPGRYGLFTVGSASYLKLGSVLSQSGDTVTRKLLTHVGAEMSLAPDAAFSGWYFETPDELHLPYRSELIGTPVGPCPAWLFPAATETGTWAIQIHGRGTTRAECLRAVPVMRAAEITSLVVSYRNDGDAPRSRGGAYGLGSTEWRDVEAAIGFARRQGATRILVMGWSMGGAIALQLALHSAHRDIIAGIILESPVIDWRRVLNHQAKIIGLPAPMVGLAISALRQRWTTPITGADDAIAFERLDAVARAAELRHPLLILHSDDDDFVPSAASHDLAAARPDLVELHRFDVARHTKLWNYDSERWSAAISAWLDRIGASTHAV